MQKPSNYWVFALNACIFLWICYNTHITVMQQPLVFKPINRANSFTILIYKLMPAKKIIGADPVKGTGLLKTILERLEASYKKNDGTFISELEAFLLMPARKRHQIFFPHEVLAETVVNNISETPYLRHISAGKNPTISACVGGQRASLAHANKTFSGYLDGDFKNWNLDTAQPVTKEIEAEVWEMHAKYGTLNDIFTSFGTNLQNIKFDSQEQVEKFCADNKSWLQIGGNGTFFLFSEKIDGKEQYFVAFAYFFDDGLLECSVSGLSRDFVYRAMHRHR